MENKHDSLISEQEPDLLYLNGVNWAKELTKIPFYFCEVSPDMEFIPYPKKRRIQPTTTPSSTPPPLQGEEKDIREEFKKSPICVIDDHKLSTQSTPLKSSSRPQSQQLQSTTTCNNISISHTATEISIF
ncbi:hypothetical protein L1987_84282 [Smallanthus sonchifolius]|uniref:Uncharacterized protein n=1 Tax=Smallanthus sonchifolius TaxID=185202 RepID=A0ACB8YEX9_9ASTR|nr:hypothetical protein L1987_84282 [Smallanthus sonchifolius]